MYNNLTVIRNYNTKLFSDLEPVIKKWGPNQKIGQIFILLVSILLLPLLLILQLPPQRKASVLTFPPFFVIPIRNQQSSFLKVYTQYVKDYEQARSDFANAKKNCASFRNFMEVRMGLKGWWRNFQWCRTKKQFPTITKYRSVRRRTKIC